MTRPPADPGDAAAAGDAEAGAASALAAALRPLLPLPLGTLRVWGDWFGRPMENFHTVVGAEAAGDVLALTFDQGELLTVEAPRGWRLQPDAEGDRLRIETAARVTWDWFAYGRPRTADHRYREEHWCEDGRIKARSTADWYRPTFQPDPSLPAVEFL